MAYQSRHEVFYMMATCFDSIRTPSSGHLENYMAMVSNTNACGCTQSNRVGLIMALLWAETCNSPSIQ